MNPHRSFRSDFGAILQTVWVHRDLIWQMTRREVIGRYRGSAMGLAWSFLNPVFLLAVYTFVFSVVFKSKWGLHENESKTDFAIILFVGMIVYALFAECINRAPGLILANVNYVKKVIFPLEILPIVALGATLFHTLASLGVLIIAMVVLRDSVFWTVILFPLILLPLMFVTLGLSWFLASLGVYLRDVAQTTTILTSVLLFLSPVFYAVSALPPEFQSLLMLNPLTFIIEQSRAVLVWGKTPDWGGLAIYFAFSLAITWFGFWWFQKTRRGFADVL